MKTEYKIERFSYIPSVFGENKRKFNPETDFLVVSKDDFFMELSYNI
jgi:hypothetical protein